MYLCIELGLSYRKHHCMGCIRPFAYFSNKKYVFESYTPTWKERAREVTSFFGFRFLTYLVDILVMILLIEVLSINELWAKIWTM